MVSLGSSVSGRFCLLIFHFNRPIIHLEAVSRLFRIVYTHDLSLALNAKPIRSRVQAEAALASRMRWRYRLEWRDNQRCGELVKARKEGFGYWLFLEGKVSEQLEKQDREYAAEKMMEGKWMLERVKEDIAKTPEGIPAPDASQWKAKAMERLAKMHQEDYEKKDFRVSPQRQHTVVNVELVFLIFLAL